MNVTAPKWRNWQTRYVQGVVPIRECGFDSHLRHQNHMLANSVGLVGPALLFSEHGARAERLKSTRRANCSQSGLVVTFEAFAPRIHPSFHQQADFYGGTRFRSRKRHQRATTTPQTAQAA